MTKYEFKVVPAPERARKLSREERDLDPIAATLSEAMNELGLRGWNFVRMETVSMAGQGFLGGKSESRNLLIFRRELSNYYATEREKSEPVRKVTARRVTRPEAIADARDDRKRADFSVALEDVVKRRSATR